MALTHIFDATLATSSLALAHMMLRYRPRFVHLHIPDATLPTWSLALAHITDTTLPTWSLALAHIPDATLQVGLCGWGGVG